jgi:hypothetical protein
MSLSIIAHLIAHAWRQCELTTIFQFCMQLTLQAQQDVPPPTPVIGQISRAVFDHPHTR